MFEWLRYHWPLFALLGVIVLIVVAIGYADERSKSGLPQTQRGTAVESVDMDGGVTCYLAHSSGGELALSCLRRPQ